MESGRQKWEVEARWIASNYIVTILKMGDERWPKICLKEEMRNWENGNASKWIKDIEDQTAQEDWYRMDTSRYCPVYGE